MIYERVINKFRKVMYRIQYSSGINLYGPGETPTLNENLNMYFDDSSREALVKIYGKYFDSAPEMDFSKRACLHDYSFLGFRSTHGDCIQWSKDPVTGKNWGNNFSFDIVYKGPDRLGDIKLPWELNKHQYFFILGEMYWLTDNTDFRDEIMLQIDSWIDANQRYRGINWISALEIGMRVISWIMVYPFIQGHCTERFLSKYTGSLCQQLTFIEQNLSYSEFSNTHLVGEASALIMGGLFLNTSFSQRWVSKGIRIMSDEIEHQTLADGVDREQSMSYQRFFLDYYYLIIILLKKNSIVYPEAIDKQVEHMTEFILNSLKPNGHAPSFGDADDARGIFIKKDCLDDYHGLLSLGAVLFNRRDFKSACPAVSEEVIWLMNEKGVERFNEIEPSVPDQCSAAYPEGGYYIMRNNWGRSADYLFFDCGPLGHGPAGHGHADALSFQLSMGGEDYLIDPGTYSYNLDYEWRDYFRSTAAHNTITVDGFNQSEINDRMSWKTIARSRCHQWMSTDFFDFVDGEHDGYSRLDDPVNHRRVIFFNKDHYCIIVDKLTCNNRHTFDYYLHMHPDCSIKDDFQNSRLEIHSQDDKKIIVSFVDDKAELSFKLFRGDEESRLGWYSERYGTRTPCTTLQASKESDGSTDFLTFISSRRLETDMKSDSGSAFAVSVFDPEHNCADNVFYSLFEPERIEKDRISFFGKYLYLRRIDEQPDSMYISDFHELSLDGRTKVKADNSITSLHFSNGRCTITLAPDNVEGLRVYWPEIKDLFINGIAHIIHNGSPVLMNQ